MLDLTPWSEAVAPVRERFGPLIAAACRWHEDRAQPTDPDLFALICAGSLGWDEDAPDSDLAPLLWTRLGMRKLLWAGIPNWCSLHRATTWPLDVVPATWQWLDFLHETGRLDPRSDPLWELRKPLICYGGLDFAGRWRPETDPSPIPCECHLPYRESVEYLNHWLERSGGTLYEELFAHGAEDRFSGGGTARVGGRWMSEARGDAGPGPVRPPKRSGRRPGRTRKRGNPAG